MKKISSLILITTFFIFFLFSNSFSQTYQFLNLDLSARAAALGGTFVANNDDPDVIFYNPAGLSLLKKNPISFSFVKHLLDINLASLSYSTEWKGVGRIGAAVSYINYGTFTQADENGNKTGQFGAGETAFILGYSNSLGDDYYYGANVKFIYSSIADRSSTAIALDLGLHYAIPSALTDVGFAILNAGTQITEYYSTKEDLPFDVVLGVSKKMEHLPLRLSLDFHNLNANTSSFFKKFDAFSIGAEFYLSRVLSLRFGYNNSVRNDLTIGSFAGLAGFNVGIGAIISNYEFDYGFSSMGLVGGLHRISVSTSL